MDGNILNAFATLSLVVVALGVLLFIVRKFVNGKNQKDQILDMKIISKMQLNPKNQLYVVQAGNKKLLLGVSESGIRNLTDLGIEDIPKVNTVEPKPVNHTSKVDVASDNLSFTTFLKSTFVRAN
ncbi:MAG: flagellar biosynthetic protein FliO [Candidatus Kapabacteria bacterium]|nr:flagellar biosynthetic protein FliO [Ignavibacteriota bacterium]MCW5885260.1 flagellar biosynthetic protein FliO [Candidatus Kapabacteria bacterium]